MTDAEVGPTKVRGWWVLTTLVPFGFIAPAGFAYAAHRARVRSWYLWALGWGLLTYTGLAINIPAVEDSDLDGFSSVLMVGAWFGAFVNALVIRGEYVRRASGVFRDPVFRARKRIKERREAQELARGEPEVARELGVGRPDVPGAEWMGVVDVNHASAEAIATVTRLDPAVVERIVRARLDVRGFSSAEDVGHVLDLDPDVVEQLRNVTVYLPR